MDSFSTQPQADDQAYADWLEMSRFTFEIIDEEDWVNILSNEDADIDLENIEDMPF